MAREPVPTGTTPEDEAKKAEIKKAQEKLMQVQTGLYKALYYIIEDYKEPHNNALNSAIGRALAIVVRNYKDINDLKLQEEIPSLINVLKPVVAEAVKAVEKIK